MDAISYKYIYQASVSTQALRMRGFESEVDAWAAGADNFSWKVSPTGRHGASLLPPGILRKMDAYPIHELDPRIISIGITDI